MGAQGRKGSITGQRRLIQLDILTRKKINYRSMTTRNNKMDMQTDLLQLLVARRGHFKLESGHHGNLWLDLDQLFLRPAALQPFARQLADRLAQYRLNAVCGPLVGGAFIAQMVAIELNIEFYYTEKTVPPQPTGLYPFAYRIPVSVLQLLQEKRIGIIDDVINAGSAVRSSFAALQSCQAKPVVLGALLVVGNSLYEFCAGQHLALETITRLSSSLWAPAECPLCASQIALEDLTHHNNDPP
jgi:orotate phosphoribosyltransferase